MAFVNKLEDTTQKVHEFKEYFESGLNEFFLEFCSQNLEQNYYSKVWLDIKKRILSARTSFQFELEEDIERAVQLYIDSISILDEIVRTKMITMSERLCMQEMCMSIPNIPQTLKNASLFVQKVSKDSRKKATIPIQRKMKVRKNDSLSLIKVGFPCRYETITYYHEIIDDEMLKNCMKEETLSCILRNIKDHCKLIEKKVTLPTVTIIVKNIEGLKTDCNTFISE